MQPMEQQFHIRCKPGDVGRYCILPGDPGRVPAIAALLDGALLLAVWAAAPLAGTGATFVTVEWLCPLCALIRVGLTLAGVLL